MFITGMLIEPELPEKEYYSKLPVVRALQGDEPFRFNAPVTVFTGENGTGKSTLIEAIALRVGLNAEGGSRNFTFSTRNTSSGLWEYVMLTRGRRDHDSFFLRAESLYNLASEVDRLGAEGSYGGQSLHEQSHGESFLSLIHNRMNKGLYILDEPEAALSPMRQLSLLVEMQYLVQAGSQLIIATHSPILMAFPGAEIYELNENGFRLTAWEDTEHVRITKRFLSDKDRMLKMLMSDN